MRAADFAGADHSVEPQFGADFGTALLTAPVGLQPKLTVNAPGDSYEQEADRVADQVMRMPEPGVQRQCACGSTAGGACEDCQKAGRGAVPKSVQRVAAGLGAVGEAPASVQDVLNTPGQPLDATTRAFFEPRFGRDLSAVRVHADPEAADSAAAVRARAYTVGSHIAFAAGRFAPDTGAGRSLLAHELTHVLQQNAIQEPATGLETQAPLSSNTTTGREAGRAEEGTPSVRSRPPHPALHRQAAGPAPAVALPTLTGSLAEQLIELMTAVAGVRPSDVASGLYVLELRGQRINLTEPQRDQLLAQARKALRDGVQKSRRSADFARSGLAEQEKVNAEFPITSRIAGVLGGTGGAADSIRSTVAAADGAAAQAEAAITAGDLVAAATALATAETEARRAGRQVYEFREGLVGGGESAATALEYTRDASFVTLGVLSIIATGGAAAAGSGAVTTTTAFGFEVGTASAANAIAVGAPVAATVGTAGVQLALGDKVDWVKVTVDIAVNLILAKFGGKLANGIYQKLLGNPAVRGLTAAAFGRVLSGVIVHEGSTAFTTAVDEAYRRARGQDVSWDQFTDELINRLTDPKGVFIAALMGAVAAGADVKLGGSRGVEITDASKNPTGEIDEVRGGVIREKKSALGIGTINPKTGQPFTNSSEKAWAEKQIYDKTMTRINNLGTADATRASAKMTEDPAQGAGSRSFPTVKELQGVRKYEFVIESDTPTLRKEVEF
ncbi:MAG TPA: DUF4157 domain-containing protein [Urbifossiella sp.]|nr:DUF4157 domain-containing protein [Urbifossiella sp.]